MTFRSPLLQTYPTRRDPQKVRVQQRRALVVSLLGFAIGIPCAMVWLRLPPVQGWGHGLYWCHDYLFLPLKGYAYTRFLPYSIVAWSLIGLVALGSLFRFLTGISLLHTLHLALLAQTLSLSSLRKILLTLYRKLGRFAPGTQVMVEVCDALRQDLLGLAPASPAQTGALLGLTRFQCELALLPSAPADLWVRAALALQEALERLPIGQAPDPAAKDLLRHAIPLFARAQARTRERNTPSDTHALNIISCLQDLLVQAFSFDPSLVAKAPALAPRSFGRGLSMPMLVAALAKTNDKRRDQLDALCRYFEQSNARFRPVPPLPFATVPTEELVYWGRFYLSLVMNQARLEGSSRQANRHLDSIESLRLSLALVEDDHEEGVSAKALLLRFLGRLPEPRHFGSLAQLTQARVNSYQTLLQESTLEQDGYVHPDDFAEVHEAVWAHDHAAGPDQGQRLVVP